jgi:hypothetical protein
LNANQVIPQWGIELLQAVNDLRGELRREVRNMAVRSYNSSARGDNWIRSLENSNNLHPADFPATLTAFYSLEHPALDDLLAHYDLAAIPLDTDDAHAQKIGVLGDFIGVRV